jgi:hypothetical protein
VVCRIGAMTLEMSRAFTGIFKKLGFHYVTLDRPAASGPLRSASLGFEGGRAGGLYQYERPARKRDRWWLQWAVSAASPTCLRICGSAHT